MARSLASAPPSFVTLIVRGQGPQLPGERVHVGLHRAGLAVAEPEQAAADEADDDGDTEEDQLRHDPTSVTVCEPVPQSAPPAHVSFFQIGTVALRVSITNLAASNASARCGDDATTTTAGSPTARRPTRCNIAIRGTSGHRAR